MMLDNTLKIADNLAFGSASTVIDLGEAKTGRGEPIRLVVSGSASLAGATGITITDGATNAAADALATKICTLAGQTHEFILPSDVNRYLKVVLAGAPSAGTWNCFVVAEPVQSND